MNVHLCLTIFLTHTHTHIVDCHFIFEGQIWYNFLPGADMQQVFSGWGKRILPQNSSRGHAQFLYMLHVVQYQSSCCIIYYKRTLTHNKLIPIMSNEL